LFFVWFSICAIYNQGLFWQVVSFFVDMELLEQEAE
jgi:hypothetical protein